jgi:tRNA threonylcarbamoyladenosine biosynthesis protein TsaB
MRIIAIESSGRHGSLATLTGVGDEATLVREACLSGNQRTAQLLAPKLRQLLADVGWPPKSIDVVAIANGPGSFTGLRIGVTTAKALAYAVQAELIAVNTLEVIASQVPHSAGRLWAILDAQRQELFAARFVIGDDGRFQVDQPPQTMPQEVWLAQLQPHDRVTGPALRRLAARLPMGVIAASEDMWEPTATATGQLAWQAYCRGQRDDLWKLAPAYFRLSAAEEKAMRNPFHPN